MVDPSKSSPTIRPDNAQISRIKSYVRYIAIAWSLLMLTSALLTVREHNKTVTDFAIIEARTALDRDILYRSWVSSHGALYAPVSENNPPNPYLQSIPQRDITTTSGQKLTLINPAYMTRQVNEHASKNQIFNGSEHLTSLNPIRPENAPDPWEKRALVSFVKGSSEVSEIVEVDGKSFVRLMRFFVTDNSCLKCHGGQGYKVGDVRGGLSITLPVQHVYDTSHKLIIGTLSAQGLIWLLGLSITFFGSKHLIGSVIFRQQSETELREQSARLEKEIADRQVIQDSLRESETKLQEQNYELRTTEEMLRAQLGEYELSQTQLKELNSNLRALFEVSPLPIIISSFDSGIVREVNRTFCTVFGYQHKEAIGKTGLDLGLWDDISERHYYLRIISEQKNATGFPAEIRNSSGEVRYVQMYGTTSEYRNEKCLLIVFMDVTDQKRTEDELRQSQKMDVVGQLAGGVAHDFNNMLTAIIGSAEMMERYVKDNPVQAKLLATIQEAAGRSADLTGQLLAFSRKGSSMPVQVWLNKTVQLVIGLLERTIDKNIHLETRLTAVHDLVIGDQTQLQNALINLGINARDAMPDGGIITFSTATVFLDSDYCGSYGSHIQPGQYVEISVSDTGTGIKKGVLDHIFEPFFTTKEIGKGTGLGLAAVYGTVKEHNGSIKVYSEPGIGTVFKLYFPVAPQQAAVEVSDKQEHHGSGGILLVDDERLIREMGQVLLEEHGYRVFLAEDGKQALEVYEQEKEHISLVIMDVVMPVMGGREALQHLIARHPGINVLMSSGFHQDESNDSFVQLGAKGFVQKPYRTQELFKVVDDVIQNSRKLTCLSDQLFTDGGL